MVPYETPTISKQYVIIVMECVILTMGKPGKNTLYFGVSYSYLKKELIDTPF